MKAAATTQMKEDRTVTHVYKCEQCGAVDRPSFFTHEVIPQAINCWNCHAGRGKTIQQQEATGVGMLIVTYATELRAIEKAARTN